MTLEHAKELLGNIVEHVAAGNNTPDQIEKLQLYYGLTNDDLREFGYSEEDIKKYGE